MKLIIIDDNPQSCADLQQKLGKYEDMQVAGVAHNGFDGLELINRCRPDVVFLDVELPDVAGLSFLERSAYLQESGCRVVVYTAYDKYILPALRKKAHDVLLKPVDEKELEVVVKRLHETDNRPKSVSGSTSDDDKYVLFTNSVDFTVIGQTDVGLFQYNPDTRSWEAVVAGIGYPVKLRRNIKGDRLKEFGPQFVRVHQRYIINVDYLLNVVDTRCHFFPPFDKVDYVVVGRIYREKLLNRFQSL